MQIAILSRVPQSYSTQRLHEAANKAGHTAEILDPFGFYLHIGDSGKCISYEGKPADDFDVVIPRISRTTAKYGEEVVAHFEWVGIPVVNSANAIANARHKFRSLRILAEHNLPVPPSLTVGTTSFLEGAVTGFGDYPFILKPFYGTHGRGVMLIDTETSLVSTVDMLCDLHQDYVIQPFIGEAAGADIRIFVVGNEAIAGMKRCAPSGKFRANIHRGASGKAFPLSADYSRLAIEAAVALELKVAGVDMIQTAEGPVILEVNPSPGFEELESVTGIDIAAAIIRFAAEMCLNRANF